MAQHTFNSATFRQQFPLFADSVAYPDAQLSMYWTMATLYFTDHDICPMGGAMLDLALIALTAHFTQLNVNYSTGNMAVGVTSGATVDKVSVSIAVPPTANNWRSWLLSTPFGATFLALLEKAAAGGFSVGGNPETSAIRKVGGVF